MRLTFSILAAVLAAVAIYPQTAQAQYAWAPQPGNPAAGQVQPVAGGYSLHFSDLEEGPAVSPVSYSAEGSCDTGGCSSGNCGNSNGSSINCKCSRCQRSSLFCRSFGGIENLIWWNKGITLPALVSTSPAGTPQATAGVLPAATVVFGGGDIDADRQTGGRLTFGAWLDDDELLAVGGKFYGVESGDVTYAATSTGAPILAIPFFNSDALVNAEDALLVAYPGLTTGAINMVASNDFLGAEVFGRSLLDMGSNYRVDLYGGYQYNRIDSDLAMTSLANTGVATFQFNDLFDVENEFHAGALGVYAESYRGMWTMSALGKIAVGNMSQQVTIAGNNTVTAGGAVTTDGGLFTQPTNIGTYNRNVLVWAPEANFKLSCAVTERLSLTVGYTFMYFTRMAFAGDQVDRNVNATQLNGGAVAGAARPAFTFRDTDFWVQTIDLGVSWTY